MSVKPTIEESVTMFSAKQFSSPTCIAILDDTKDCYAPDCPCARIPAHDPLLESCMTLEHKIVEVQNSFPGCGTSEFDGKTIVHEHRAIGRDWEDAYTRIPKTERATLLEAVREHEHNLAEEIKTLRTNLAEAIAQRDAWKKLSVTAIAAENTSVSEYVVQLESQIDATEAGVMWFAQYIISCLNGTPQPEMWFQRALEYGRNITDHVEKAETALATERARVGELEK